MTSNEEEKRCPLCAEEMDWTDQQFMPCKCGYQICVWCWHHIIDMAEKDTSEGRCPACRTIYEKEKIVAMQAKCEKTMTKISNRKSKPPKAAKPKANDVKKDLTNVRVIQRKMAYVIGLPLSVADEDVLLRKDYFGQYGKVTKVSLSRTAGGAIQQFVNDTCSAYITYSKEEEALRCIQSVHGFFLEGRYLRASFGTAKYCHAWLKNMPCNNPSCLYLHSIGADEDSFGKDEVAAVHTRSRVQQIAGATNTAAKRSGNTLPPADDAYNCIFSSTDKSTMICSISDAAHGSANSTCDITYPLPCREKEGAILTPHKMTSFVDIVGRSNRVDDEQDQSSPEDRRFLDMCSKLSSLTVSGDVQSGESYSASSLFEVSASGCHGNGLYTNSSDKPLQNGALVSNRQGSKDTCGSSHTFSLRPSYPEYLAEHSDRQALTSLLPEKTQSVNDFTVDQNSVNNHEDEASLPFRNVNSILNDSFQERRFQNSAKSDRVYRSSRSFSNEEIVEHLRRIDDDDTSTNNVKNPALDAVESSIISNIMSLDFDSCEDSMTVPNRVSELVDETYGYGYGGSSWSSKNTDQAGYSYAKQEGFQTQKAGSILPDYSDKKELYLHKSQYPVNRAQCLAPPGFSVPSRDPPPGFSNTDRGLSLPRGSSGVPLTNTSSMSTRLNASSNYRDSDLFDPTILSFANGKQTNGFSNPGGYGAWPLGGNPRLSSFEENESRLWLMMQQKSSNQDSNFLQMFPSQTPSITPESYTGHLRNNRLPGFDDIYGGLSSRAVDQHQSFFTDMSNGERYPSMGEVQRHKGEAAELGSNERLGGGNTYLSRYSDVVLNRGDVYAPRVFGL
ncbi:uncharacterized protein LOC127243969 [Andrographis paniculata]|uniref:uncharacterized protein LOC127243969 n=1 Tax=Andrographis paniculata TaxID=175694 RepID=UPI0021E7A8FF|nr:uncharacterized protein LOC127243969 [Andrographis paniculata]